jgi:D-glycero-alpha-D-manno-heptose-7-phosphate kinase
VALVRALATLCELPLTTAEVAELACRIETQDLGMPIGYQDQYAASVGGLNALEFRAEGVTSRAIELAPDTRREIERRMLLFFTGVSRNSGTILSDQSKSIRESDREVLESLHRIRRAAYEMEATLRRGDLDLVGEILHDSWQQKRRLASGISNARIDEHYDLARREGAIGGKITGAGGGGFLLLWCRLDTVERVAGALEAAGLHRMEFRLEESGVQVVMNAMPRLPTLRNPRHDVWERTYALAP